MSATEIIAELPKLTEAERRAVLSRLLALTRTNEYNSNPDPPSPEPADAAEGLAEQTGAYRDVDLRARGIGETHAAELRARLKTFAEDWDRPEATIYDEMPAR